MIHVRKIFPKIVLAMHAIIAIFFVYLLFVNTADAKQLELPYTKKTEIIYKIEDLADFNKAFFHDGFMDEIHITKKDLGVYFKKEFLEEENKLFFETRARIICRVIRESVDDVGSIKIYFYQKTLIRKYNEEGLAVCNLRPKGFSVTMENRFSRYRESIIKWGFISAAGVIKFLTDP